MNNPIPKDDPFWKIIAYLNDNNMQGDSRLWKTSTGYQWIYWSRHGWDRIVFDKISDWPIKEVE